MLGRLMLVIRLLGRDLRRRRTESLLLLTAITAATATLTLGIASNVVVTDAYAQTAAATAGPDVVARTQGVGPAALDALERVAYADGVTGSSGPFPVAFLLLRAHGKTVHAVVEGRDRRPAAVDRPAVTDGGWVRPGGVVVERAFADALRVKPGESVLIGGHSVRVEGIGITAARPPFPNAGWHEPWTIQGESGGAIWADRSDLAALAGDQPLSYTLNLTLRDPSVYETLPRPEEDRIDYFSAEFFADRFQRVAEPVRTALLIGSWLLAGLAVAGVAGIVAGRVVGQRRRVGLLKAVGAGPGTVAVVHLAEYLVIGLAAAGLGLLAGWFAAPALTSPGAGVVGTVGVHPPPLRAAVAAVLLAVAIAVAATMVPVVRAAFTSTLRALADAPAAPRRRGWRVRVSRRLPTPVLLGVRINARRPRRAGLVTINAFITTTGLAAVLAVHAQRRVLDHLGPTVLADPRTERLHEALFVVAAVLCGLALLNAAVSTWSAVLDARQPLAVARTLGATPRQAGIGMAVAQLLPAVPGVVVGLFAGQALYLLNDDGAVRYASGAALAGIGGGVLVVMAGLTVLPALAAARRPVAESLSG
ncbi:FtsX-like permease family protein [Cryptosporangium phraense]|uniref:FtsX-like permease family protein n=1 Tax=Cryptosporangium phraense TaxID=2593070 RepID=A0A545AS41_9ACTN|nr:FtsX-like permease family protein [Cryptosporangium phraense]TQS44083.1 FtsX-like permease family protein [Cryptosporangium phraense]